MTGTKANHISGPFSFWKANMQLFLRTALSSSKIYWLPCFCSYATHSLSCSPVFMSIKMLWKRWHWWLLLYFSLLSYSLQLEDNVESLCLACTKLYQVLNEGNMLGKRFKRRSMLLKTLYKLVEIDSDPLCLKLAKIILSVSVSKCYLVECEAQNCGLQLVFSFSFHSSKRCLNEQFVNCNFLPYNYTHSFRWAPFGACILQGSCIWGRK